MIYGNKFLNEGFFDKFKKKYKNQRKSKRIDLTSEEKDLIENTLKAIL